MTGWAASLTRDGDRLVLRFSKPVRRLELTADEARQLAASLLLAAEGREPEALPCGGPCCRCPDCQLPLPGPGGDCAYCASADVRRLGQLACRQCGQPCSGGECVNPACCVAGDALDPSDPQAMTIADWPSG